MLYTPSFSAGLRYSHVESKIMVSNDDEPRTFKLQRGFKWIGPFFASLIPFAVWAFFFPADASPDVQGGLLAVGAFVLLALYCHLTAVRTFVTITRAGVEVGGVLGTRAARWPDVRHASIDRGDVVLHLTSGKPLRISGYLDRIDWIVSFVEARGLFREVATD